MRRAVAVGFAATYGLPGAVRVLADHRGFEPLLDEGKNAAIDNALGHHGHQFGVRDAVEVLRQIGVYDLGVACPQRAGDVVHGIVGRRLWETWYQATGLQHSGAVDLTPVVTHRYPIERFADAFAQMESGDSGKVVLTWDE